MQSIVLIIALAVTFIFGYFVVRALECFPDENQVEQEPETDGGHLTDQVEK